VPNIALALGLAASAALSSAGPIMKSFEPGEDWGWCYIDESALDAGRWPVRGPVAHSPY